MRVAAQLPFRANFDMAPDGSSPGGWINTNGKYLVKKLPDGNLVLSKVNNDARPPLAKAIGYITEPDASNYTVQADFMGTQVRGKMPDAGLVNSRYSFLIDGKPDPDRENKHTVRITSWEARPRVNVVVTYDWKPDVWYTAKFAVEQKEKTALVRGKVWPKGEAEPADWTVSFEDPYPIRVGAAGLYGYIPNVQETDGKADPGSELYFDNLSVTPNGQEVTGRTIRSPPSSARKASAPTAGMQPILLGVTSPTSPSAGSCWWAVAGWRDSVVQMGDGSPARCLKDRPEHRI